MNPRISTSMMYQQSVSHMLGKQARISHLGRQLDGMTRIVTAKDDPVAAGAAQRLERTLAELKQYGKNANGVESRLGLQENALTQAKEVMDRIKDLVIEANSGVRSQEDRTSIAGEIGQLEDTLLNLANSSDGHGRYLFAGTADAALPFTRSGGTLEYHGNRVQREIEIAPDTRVKDTVPGDDVFFNIGPEHQDVFSMLDQLREALSQPASTPDERAALNAAVDAGLRDIALTGERLIDARAGIGAQLKQIGDAAELRAANSVTLETDLLAIRGLDFAEAIGELNLEKIALEAAQRVFMQMQGMSLFARMG